MGISLLDLQLLMVPSKYLKSRFSHRKVIAECQISYIFAQGWKVSKNAASIVLIHFGGNNFSGISKS